MKGLKINSNYVYFLTRLFILLVLLLTVLNINKIFANKKVLGGSIDTASVMEQKSYYQKLIQDNPTYIDGYLELSKISAFLGDKDSQKIYLEAALKIDPNNKEVADLLAQVSK